VGKESRLLTTGRYVQFLELRGLVPMLPAAPAEAPSRLVPDMLLALAGGGVWIRADAWIARRRPRPRMSCCETAPCRARHGCPKRSRLTRGPGGR
jgi:hypothetical protein